MKGHKTLSELLPSRSYQWGWKISLHEFDAQQMAHNREQFSLKQENIAVETKRQANKHTVNEYA